jgi:hypothetical protein
MVSYLLETMESMSNIEYGSVLICGTFLVKKLGGKSKTPGILTLGKGDRGIESEK